MQGWFNIQKLIKVKKTTKEKHIIISIDSGKALDKIQHPLLTSEKLSVVFLLTQTEWNFCSMINGLYKNHP